MWVGWLNNKRRQVANTYAIGDRKKQNGNLGRPDSLVCKCFLQGLEFVTQSIILFRPSLWSTGGLEMDAPGEEGGG